MTPAIDSSAPGIPIGAANWLRHAPSGWTPRRLGHLLLRNDGGVWGEDGNETDTIVLRSTEVSAGGSWDIRNPARRRLTRAEMASGLLAKGDLVVVKSSGSELHLGKTALVSGDVAGLGCTFSNFMQRLRLDSNAEPRYAFYLLNSSLGREQLNYFGSTTTGLRNLNGAILSRLLWPGPPIEEQRVIADFLDRETAKIDALVAKKRRLIELLQEKRTALISHTVMKGLDPDTPMKDCDIQWLGDIPRHWELLPLKRIAETRYGLGQPPAEHAEGIPMIRATDISRGAIAEEGMMRVDPEDVPKTRDAFLAPGEIIVVRSGAYTGDSAIVPQHLAGCVAGYDMVVRVRRGDPSFISWQLLADVVRVAQWEPLMLRAAQPHLNVEELANTLVCRPPEREQRRIAQHLARETTRLDELGGKERQLMKLLREYRSALITASVTGQIDVRTCRREAS